MDLGIIKERLKQQKKCREKAASSKKKKRVGNEKVDDELFLHVTISSS